VAPWQVFDYRNETLDSIENIDWQRSSPAQGTIRIDRGLIRAAFDGGQLDGLGQQLSVDLLSRDDLIVPFGAADSSTSFVYTREGG